LYIYTVVIEAAVLQAKYATTDTKEEFWASWKRKNTADTEGLLMI
jgi:type I restriction enzyme R subunit